MMELRAAWTCRFYGTTRRLAFHSIEANDAVTLFAINENDGEQKTW